ncbi:MAG TPA: anti-sigma factor [Blastocatellia bacterium]|nr:anti-sigma factor [Blastocatellia bacterium]
MTWDEVKELAPLYVIGALDEKTAHDLEASLHGVTPEQRRVVARWLDVAAMLPQALPLQTPPDYLKERMLNRIAEEAQKTPIEIAVEESALEKMAEQAENRVLPFVQPRRAESRTARWMLIAATALLAFTSAYLFNQNAKLARERDDLARERDGLSQDLAASRRQVDEIVSSKTRVIAMVGDEVPQANAKVLWDTKEQQWVIYIFDLPAPPSDKDYQLWYVTANAKISAKTFSTDEQGRAFLKLTLPPEALTGLAATAVTLEPKGGSPQPTGKFYLKASI